MHYCHIMKAPQRDHSKVFASSLQMCQISKLYHICASALTASHSCWEDKLECLSECHKYTLRRASMCTLCAFC